MELMFPFMTFVIQAATVNEDLAFAVAMLSFFRTFGQTINLTIVGIIFQNEVRRMLLAYPALVSKAIEYSRDSSTLVQIIKASLNDLRRRS